METAIAKSPKVQKGEPVVYIDGLGRTHPALVISVNQLHIGRITLAYVDVNAPERENLKQVNDIPHVTMVKETNPELPNYEVNCWKTEGEHHHQLPKDHPGFDHPFQLPKFDENGNRISVARPEFEKDLEAHQATTAPVSEEHT